MDSKSQSGSPASPCCSQIRTAVIGRGELQRIGILPHQRLHIHGAQVGRAVMRRQHASCTEVFSAQSFSNANKYLLDENGRVVAEDVVQCIDSGVLGILFQSSSGLLATMKLRQQELLNQLCWAAMSKHIPRHFKQIA